MKKCKYCQTEIEDKAKVCPICKKDLRNFFQKHIILTILLVLFLIGSIELGIQGNRNNGKVEVVANSNTVVQKKYINVGETISGKDWEITMEETKFEQRVNPPTQPAYYTYYQVKDTDNIYLAIILNVKNISTLDLRSDKVCDIKVKYNNAYTYTSFSAIEDDMLGFTYTSISDIKPLTNKKIYFLAEMPKTIADETDTPVELEIKFDNQTYYYKIR